MNDENWMVQKNKIRRSREIDFRHGICQESPPGQRADIYKWPDHILEARDQILISDVVLIHNLNKINIHSNSSIDNELVLKCPRKDSRTKFYGKRKPNKKVYI